MGVINLGAIVEKLKKAMSGSFVTKTTYPSGTDAGVIKVDSTYATAVTTGGKLKATEITAEAYAEANDAAFVSKATLDNVLAAQPSGGLTETELFKGSTNLSADQALSDKITGYKFLVCVFADQYSEHFNVVVPVSFVVLGTTKFNGSIGTSFLVNFSFSSGETVDSVHKESTTGTVTLQAVYGYK